MAKRRSSQSLFAALVLLTILSTYKASSTRRCKYSSFVSDIVMESCVRRALASKLKIDHVTKGNISQLSEYTDIWKECKEASIGSSCYTYKHHNSVILEMKIQIINIWNELVKLAQTWDEYDVYGSQQCIKNLKHSVRLCLPIIKAYASRIGKGNLRVLQFFMDCVGSDFKSCNEKTRKYFLEIMNKNVIGRAHLIGDNMESLKECTEMVDKTKLDKCAPGMLDFLIKVTSGELIITEELMKVSDCSCVLDALSVCNALAHEMITELLQNFLNRSLCPVKLNYRNKEDNYILMPDDRNEIGRCLEKSDKKEIDKCEPGLSRVLEGVVQGDPSSHAALRRLPQESACLGLAFKACPGSSIYIIRKVMQLLYRLDLDISLDSNSILSPPGLKENHVIDILFPKYALPDNIVKPVKECLLQTVCQLENFCGDFSDAMVNVLMNKSLTFPIEQKSECIESNYKSILKKCSAEGADLTEKLLQSVMRAYNKLEKLNISNLPSKRPYNLPGELFRTINSCLEKIDLVSFEQCCPGVTDVLRAYQKEKPIPAKFVTSRTCKYECISYATSSCAKPDASQLQSFIALTMKMYENIPSSLELLDEIASSVKITLKDGLVSIPSDEINVIKACQDKISQNLNLCCPKLNQIVTNTLNTNQITVKKEDLKWCTVYCYEPLILGCENPASFLNLVKLIMETINSTWHDVSPIAIFPAKPDYRFPRDVLSGLELCLNMVTNLQDCCAAFPKALEMLLEDKPWIPMKFNLRKCRSACYKNETKECPEESREVTLAVMVGLVNYVDISKKSIECLEKIEEDFDKCCYGMTSVIFSIYQHKGTCKFPDELEDNCNISCVMQTLNKCDVIAADMVQRIMKYIFEYKPYCSNGAVTTEMERSSTSYYTERHSDSYDSNKTNEALNFEVSRATSETEEKEISPGIGNNFTVEPSKMYHTQTQSKKYSSEETRESESSKLYNKSYITEQPSVKFSSESNTGIYTYSSVEKFPYNEELSKTFDPERVNDQYVSEGSGPLGSTEEYSKAYISDQTNPDIGEFSKTIKVGRESEQHVFGDTSILGSTEPYSKIYVTDVASSDIGELSKTFVMEKGSDQYGSENSRELGSTEEYSNTLITNLSSSIIGESRKTFETEKEIVHYSSGDSSQLGRTEPYSKTYVTDAASPDIGELIKTFAAENISDQYGSEDSSQLGSTEEHSKKYVANVASFDIREVSKTFATEKVSDQYGSEDSRELESTEEYSKTHLTDLTIPGNRELKKTADAGKISDQFSSEDSSQLGSTETYINTYITNLTNSIIGENRKTFEAEKEIAQFSSEDSSQLGRTEPYSKTYVSDVTSPDIGELSKTFVAEKVSYQYGSEDSSQLGSTEKYSKTYITDVTSPDIGEHSKTFDAKKESEQYSFEYSSQLGSTETYSKTYKTDAASPDIREHSKIFATEKENSQYSSEDSSELERIEPHSKTYVTSPDFGERSKTFDADKESEKYNFEDSSQFGSTEPYSKTFKTDLTSPGIGELSKTLDAGKISDQYGSEDSRELGSTEEYSKTLITDLASPDIGELSSTFGEDKVSEQYGTENKSLLESAVMSSKTYVTDHTSATFSSDSNVDIYTYLSHEKTPDIDIHSKTFDIVKTSKQFVSEDISQSGSTDQLSVTHITDVSSSDIGKSSKTFDSAKVSTQYSFEDSSKIIKSEEYSTIQLGDLTSPEIGKRTKRFTTEKVSDQYFSVDSSQSGTTGEYSKAYITNLTSPDIVEFSNTFDTEKVSDKFFSVDSRELRSTEEYRKTHVTDLISPDNGELGKILDAGKISDQFSSEDSSQLGSTEMYSNTYVTNLSSSIIGESRKTFDVEKVSEHYNFEDSIQTENTEVSNKTLIIELTSKTFNKDTTEEISKTIETEHVTEIYASRESNNSESQEESSESFLAEQTNKKLSSVINTNIYIYSTNKGNTDIEADNKIYSSETAREMYYSEQASKSESAEEPSKSYTTEQPSTTFSSDSNTGSYAHLFDEELPDIEEPIKTSESHSESEKESSKSYTTKQYSTRVSRGRSTGIYTYSIDKGSTNIEESGNTYDVETDGEINGSKESSYSKSREESGIPYTNGQGSKSLISDSNTGIYTYSTDVEKADIEEPGKTNVAEIVSTMYESKETNHSKSGEESNKSHATEQYSTTLSSVRSTGIDTFRTDKRSTDLVEPGRTYEIEAIREMNISQQTSQSESGEESEKSYTTEQSSTRFSNDSKTVIYTYSTNKENTEIEEIRKTFDVQTVSEMYGSEETSKSENGKESSELYTAEQLSTTLSIGRDTGTYTYSADKENIDIEEPQKTYDAEIISETYGSEETSQSERGDVSSKSLTTVQSTINYGSGRNNGAFNYFTEKGSTDIEKPGRTYDTEAVREMYGYKETSHSESEVKFSISYAMEQSSTSYSSGTDISIYTYYTDKESTDIEEPRKTFDAEIVSEMFGSEQSSQSERGEEFHKSNTAEQSRTRFNTGSNTGIYTYAINKGTNDIEEPGKRYDVETVTEMYGSKEIIRPESGEVSSKSYTSEQFGTMFSSGRNTGIYTYLTDKGSTDIEEPGRANDTESFKEMYGYKETSQSESGEKSSTRYTTEQSSTSYSRGRDTSIYTNSTNKGNIDIEEPRKTYASEIVSEMYDSEKTSESESAEESSKSYTAEQYTTTFSSGRDTVIYTHLIDKGSTDIEEPGKRYDTKRIREMYGSKETSPSESRKDSSKPFKTEQSSTTFSSDRNTGIDTYSTDKKSTDIVEPGGTFDAGKSMETYDSDETSESESEEESSKLYSTVQFSTKFSNGSNTVIYTYSTDKENTVIGVETIREMFGLEKTSKLESPEESTELYASDLSIATFRNNSNIDIYTCTSDEGNFDLEEHSKTYPTENMSDVYDTIIARETTLMDGFDEMYESKENNETFSTEASSVTYDAEFGLTHSCEQKSESSGIQNISETYENIVSGSAFNIEHHTGSHTSQLSNFTETSSNTYLFQDTNMEYEAMISSESTDIEYSNEKHYTEEFILTTDFDISNAAYDSEETSSTKDFDKTYEFKESVSALNTGFSTKTYITELPIAEMTSNSFVSEVSSKTFRTAVSNEKNTTEDANEIYHTEEPNLTLISDKRNVSPYYENSSEKSRIQELDETLGINKSIETIRGEGYTDIDTAKVSSAAKSFSNQSISENIGKTFSTVISNETNSLERSTKICDSEDSSGAEKSSAAYSYEYISKESSNKELDEILESNESSGTFNTETYTDIQSTPLYIARGTFSSTYVSDDIQRTYDIVVSKEADISESPNETDDSTESNISQGTDESVSAYGYENISGISSTEEFDEEQGVNELSKTFSSEVNTDTGSTQLSYVLEVARTTYISDETNKAPSAALSNETNAFEDSDEACSIEESGISTATDMSDTMDKYEEISSTKKIDKSEGIKKSMATLSIENITDIYSTQLRSDSKTISNIYVSEDISQTYDTVMSNEQSATENVNETRSIEEFNIISGTDKSGIPYNSEETDREVNTKELDDLAYVTSKQELIETSSIEEQSEIFNDELYIEAPITVFETFSETDVSEDRSKPNATVVTSETNTSEGCYKTHDIEHSNVNLDNDQYSVRYSSEETWKSYRNQESTEIFNFEDAYSTQSFSTIEMNGATNDTEDFSTAYSVDRSSTAHDSDTQFLKSTKEISVTEIMNGSYSLELSTEIHGSELSNVTPSIKTSTLAGSFEDYTVFYNSDASNAILKIEDISETSKTEKSKITYSVEELHSDNSGQSSSRHRVEASDEISEGTAYVGLSEPYNPEIPSKMYKTERSDMSFIAETNYKEISEVHITDDIYDSEDVSRVTIDVERPKETNLAQQSSEMYDTQLFTRTFHPDELNGFSPNTTGKSLNTNAFEERSKSYSVIVYNETNTAKNVVKEYDYNESSETSGSEMSREVSDSENFSSSNINSNSAIYIETSESKRTEVDISEDISRIYDITQSFIPIDMKASSKINVFEQSSEIFITERSEETYAVPEVLKETCDFEESTKMHGIDDFEKTESNIKFTETYDNELSYETQDITFPTENYVNKELNDSYDFNISRDNKISRGMYSTVTSVEDTDELYDSKTVWAKVILNFRDTSSSKESTDTYDNKISNATYHTEEFMNQNYITEVFNESYGFNISGETYTMAELNNATTSEESKKIFTSKDTRDAYFIIRSNEASETDEGCFDENAENIDSTKKDIDETKEDVKIIEGFDEAEFIIDWTTESNTSRTTEHADKVEGEILETEQSDDVSELDIDGTKGNVERTKINVEQTKINYDKTKINIDKISKFSNNAKNDAKVTKREDYELEFNAGNTTMLIHDTETGINKTIISAEKPEVASDLIKVVIDAALKISNEGGKGVEETKRKDHEHELNAGNTAVFIDDTETDIDKTISAERPEVVPDLVIVTIDSSSQISNEGEKDVEGTKTEDHEHELNAGNTAVFIDDTEIDINKKRISAERVEVGADLIKVGIDSISKSSNKERKGFNEIEKNIDEIVSGHGISNSFQFKAFKKGNIDEMESKENQKNFLRSQKDAFRSQNRINVTNSKYKNKNISNTSRNNSFDKNFVERNAHVPMKFSNPSSQRNKLNITDIKNYDRNDSFKDDDVTDMKETEPSSIFYETEIITAPIIIKHFDESNQYINLKKTDAMKAFNEGEDDITENYTFDNIKTKDTSIMNKNTVPYSDNEYTNKVFNNEKIVTNSDDEKENGEILYRDLNVDQFMNRNDEKNLSKFTDIKSAKYADNNNESLKNISAIHNKIRIPSTNNIKNNERNDYLWLDSTKNIGTSSKNISEYESNATKDIGLNIRKEFGLPNYNPDVERDNRTHTLQRKYTKQKNAKKGNKRVIYTQSVTTNAEGNTNIINNEANKLILDGKKGSRENSTYKFSIKDSKRLGMNKLTTKRYRNSRIGTYGNSVNSASKIYLNNSKYIILQGSRNHTYETDDEGSSDDDDGEDYENMPNSEVTELIHIFPNVTENVDEKYYRLVKKDVRFRFHIRKAREVIDDSSQENNTNIPNGSSNQGLTEGTESDYSTSGNEINIQTTFKPINLDESDTHKYTIPKEPAETILMRCTKEASNIMMHCCMPMLQALYALINEEERPLDALSVKKCNSFCFKSALQRCPKRGARIVKAVIKKIKELPVLGAEKFVDICNNTVNFALNDCCGPFILKLYENSSTEVNKGKISQEPGCAKVCNSKIFQQCFKFKPLKKHIETVISTYPESQSSQFTSMEDILIGATLKSKRVHFHSVVNSGLQSIKFKFPSEQLKSKLLNGKKFKEFLDRLKAQMEFQKQYLGNQSPNLLIKDFPQSELQDQFQVYVELQKQYTKNSSQKLSVQEFPEKELKMFDGELFAENHSLGELPFIDVSLEGFSIEEQPQLEKQFKGELSLKKKYHELITEEESTGKHSQKEPFLEEHFQIVSFPEEHFQIDSFSEEQPCLMQEPVIEERLQNEKIYMLSGNNFPSLKQSFISNNLPSENQLLPNMGESPFAKPLKSFTYLPDGGEYFLIDLEEVFPLEEEISFLMQFLHRREYPFHPAASGLFGIFVPIDERYLVSDFGHSFQDINEPPFFGSKILSPDAKYSPVRDGCMFQSAPGQLYPYEHIPFNAEQSPMYVLPPDILFPDFTENFKERTYSRFKRKISSGRAYRKRKADEENALHIPPYYKEKIKLCIYNVQNTSLDACLPGMYEYILMLSHGIRIDLPLVDNSTEVSSCISKVFQLCPTDSVLAINFLLQQFSEIPLKVTTATNIKKENVDASTKKTLNTCLSRINPETINACVKNFLFVLKEILEEGQSSQNVNITLEGEQCLGKVFSICSSRARLMIMQLMYHYKGISLDVQFESGFGVIDINKLISNEEKLSVYHCLITLNKNEVESCGHGLYSIISDLVRGSILVSDTIQFGDKECLGNAFKQCSIHSRLVIMDLISFVIDDSIDIPLYAQKSVSEPISDEERMIIAPCLSQLHPLTVDACLPGLMYVLKEVYQNSIPDLTMFPTKVSPAKCLKNSFAKCSADSRLFLTELVYRYTNIFVDLLFFFTETTADRDLLNIMNGCISSIPPDLIDGCINGLSSAVSHLRRGIHPSSGFIFNLQTGVDSICMKDIFMGCSRYHRILIDQLLRRVPRNIANTAVFDIIYSLDTYRDVHEHSDRDKELIQRCFNTIKRNYLEWCIPGLYDTLQALIELKFPLTFLALKPIKGSCLQMAFAECPYKARILIKDMLYDFAYLLIDIPLQGAPQGHSGELGPATDAIKECISSLNSTGSDSCVFGIVDILHRVFVEKVENPEPIISPDNEKTTMSCLAQLFEPCDLPVKLFFLKRIADISNINVNFLMDTFLISMTENKENGVSVDVAQSKLQDLLNSIPNALYYKIEYNRPISQRFPTNFEK